MCESMKRTVRMILGAGIVMAALLAVQPAQAHDRTVRLPTPSCGNLPSEQGFLTAIPITATALAPQGSATRRGGSVTGRGDNRFRYARITVPALAAGELRVFDATTDALSDAVLCGGSGARYITSYSAHNTAHVAAAAATTAANRADDDDPSTDTDAAARATAAASETNLGRARSALSTARGALNSARSALSAAARALSAANAVTANITAATDAEVRALNAANAAVALSTDDITAVTGKLTTAASELTAAAGSLRTASTNLITAAAAMHMGFQIRAPVSPGDQEYIVVIASQDPGTALSVNVQFHGAIDIASTPASITGALRVGGAPTYTLHISAPGLLTLETTGSTDTIGTLDDSDGAEVAQAESGGSGGNFKIVVPVPANTAADEGYMATVRGQTSTTAGDYTLDMDFKVAMSLTTAADTITGLTGVTVGAGPTWTGTPVAADDTTLRIQRRAADGNVADEDYFLLTVGDDSGFLTVEARDDTTAERDADTKGTLFGAMGEGPMGEMRTGQIATDADSGPGAHFGFTVPVEAGKQYLVKVEGTDGVYTLHGTFAGAEDHDSDPTTDKITPPADPISGTLTASTGTTQNAHRYLLSIEESGALYLHTVGSTDVTGTLYGPDGRRVAWDENSGDGNNFRIAVSVEPGLYIVEVKGAARTTMGGYILVTNFVTGAEVEDPTQPPPTPDPDPDPDPTIDPDPAGVLEEPSHNGVRSGIGLVRGWVCQDDGNGVEIRITGPSGSPDSRTYTFTAPYGSDRGDVNVSEHCDNRIVNGVGFAAQYNYNLLPAGTYTIQAFVGRERVGLTDGGQTNTFRVVRISDAEFLARVPSSGRVVVEDFPRTGVSTILEFDLSSQNFEIVGTQ